LSATASHEPAGGALIGRPEYWPLPVLFAYQLPVPPLAP